MRIRSARLAGAALMVGALVACGPVPGSGPPDPDPSSSAAPSPSPTAPGPSPTAPDPDPEALVLPETCAGLMPEAEAQRYTGAPTTVLMPSESGWSLDRLAATGYLGPASIAGAQEAAQLLHCGYGIPDSGALAHLIIAQIPASARELVVAGLDPEWFVSTVDGDVTTWDNFAASRRGADDMDQALLPMPEAHVFVGELWIANHSTYGALHLPALATLLELNPRLAPDRSG